jgi:hypothetical protein
MTERSMRELERDVEQARERLLSHLSVLSSPAAYSEFKQDLKHEARFTLRGILDDVKGRAAANPAATLAVGAGLAWRLLRQPPISAALIGAGLYSLWRTAPAPTQGRDFDYLSTAKTRLGEQMSDLATTVGQQTAQMAETVTENASQFAEAAKEKMQEWGSQASEEIADRTASVTRRTAHAFDEASRAVGRIPSNAGYMANKVISNSEGRDTLLLGAAGLAVAAALGIAYQRRDMSP